MIDKLMDTMASFANKVSKWITMPSIPWADFKTYWQEFITLIAPWNKIFPLTDLMVIIGLVVAFGLVLAILYTIVLIKSFIPMSGGK